MAEDLLNRIIPEREQKDFREFITYLSLKEERFILRNDILLRFDQFCEENGRDHSVTRDSSIYRFFYRTQELFFTSDYIVIMHRYAIARYRFYLLRIDGEHMERITLSRYLDMKDEYVLGYALTGKHLQIDYMPFYDYTPTIKDPRKIGDGMTYLNRYMSSKIFSNPEEWNGKLFEFIRIHSFNNRQLLVNGNILRNYRVFYDALQDAIDFLRNMSRDTPYGAMEEELNKMGFEPGWGNNAGRILETMEILYDLLNEPTDKLLEEFINRVPMPLISRIAIISPHGWFGQENVLGKPDTGGQVIYILDQVKALERHLKEEIELAGLDVTPSIIVVTRFIPEADGTTSNVRKEKIHQTDNCWILRIPFKDRDQNILNHWISRFDVWPYLEQFAEDASTQVVSEFQGRPDLIIGNYSDGNLVATLMSEQLNVIQCTIAHALEKTKYLFSDMYWTDFEEDYHFSLQFIADIISMNKSDFIIASTHQEIIGTDDSMGQYESYQFFTMPGNMQVEGGINLYAPKFNVIPPGVDENMYFPWYEGEDRLTQKRTQWENRLFTDATDDIFGTLADPDKMPIFTMARFDRIKNITGLVEAFGMSEILRGNCNIVFAAGSIHLEQSHDDEEREQIEKAYALIDRYNLHGSVRWLPSINKIDTGEVYRIIADKKGIFVQPALFEAFGLTILEAMLSGLPTFGPQFGGPLEIIEHGKSGFLLNTSRPDLIAEGLEEFIENTRKDKKLWDKISRNGVERVRNYFTWKLYSRRLINQTKLYGFWRYSVSEQGKIEMDRYSDMIYYFMFKERAARLM